MSSVVQHQQHLTSSDMNMIVRVHTSACTSHRIAAGSLDAKRLAILLVKEFQNGVNEEAHLLAAFSGKGSLRLSIPISSMGGLTDKEPTEVRIVETGTSNHPHPCQLRDRTAA